ncbi:MAG: hypothetical protein ACE5IK_08485 [Acidobacteriota bacterium]
MRRLNRSMQSMILLAAVFLLASCDRCPPDDGAGVTAYAVPPDLDVQPGGGGEGPPPDFEPSPGGGGEGPPPDFDASPSGGGEGAPSADSTESTTAVPVAWHFGTQPAVPGSASGGLVNRGLFSGVSAFLAYTTLPGPSRDIQALTIQLHSGGAHHTIVMERAGAGLKWTLDGVELARRTPGNPSQLPAEFFGTLDALTATYPNGQSVAVRKASIRWRRGGS